METVITSIKIIEYILLIYIGFASFYIFFFAFAGLFYRKKKRAIHGQARRIAILIPGYKEDEVIIEVTKSALQQKYPLNRFDVIVIADSFKEHTIYKLRRLPVRLIEVSFDQSTKSKALNKAMEVIGDDYDIALVLDADNIMEPQFISKINKAFSKEIMVVQGHRVAKNLNTPFAILDAISEEVNNHIFRKGHRALGLSSGLIGSGMAFDYKFFKNVMSNVKAVGGFDKELEFKLFKDGRTIEYLNDAYVMDEKIQKSEDFEKQRKRWLSTQFVYFRKYALTGLKEFFLKGNLDFINKVYQMIAPPRILLLGMVSLLTLTYFLFDFLSVSLQPHVKATYWYFVFAMTIMTFVVAVPRKFYNRETLVAALSLPKAFTTMFLLLFKLKGANNTFIHTNHTTNSQ